MAEIGYSDEAIDDLRDLVSDSDLIRALVHVASIELRDPLRADDPDEGVGLTDLRWRRGLTRAQRQNLNDTDPLTESPGLHAWDFLLIYRKVSHDAFRIIRVVPTREVLGTVDLSTVGL